MPSFVIVMAVAATLGAPAPGSAPSAFDASTAAAVAVPQVAPTVGSHLYGDLTSCEQAAAGLVAPMGTRFVCLPVEPMTGDMPSAF
ncbi:MAG TPA: hypothetical protein VE684_17945 [Crenalkalicoccus sp.]|jgi:hypothetical protein|nr:hypothetical protein [Crenalkalicoccus sp.]